MEVVQFIGAVAALLAIFGYILRGGGWLRTRWRTRKTPKDPPYPVRFTCREASEFHPVSGYHEGYVFEVFNHSDKPVRVNSFGLDLTMYTTDEWHQYEQAVIHPPVQLPRRLAPHDAFEGTVDTEGLLDELPREDFVSWKPYVEVAGFGRKYVEPEKEE